MFKPKIAITMPGKIGDILWTLPTVKEIARHNTVDFYVMDHFKGICPLIERQPYINKCAGLEDWIVDGNQALQNPNPPSLPEEYDRVVNLGYTSFPRAPLISIAAQTYGLELPSNPLPFLEVDSKGDYDIVFGFSIYIDAIRESFVKGFTDIVKETFPDLTWIDASNVPWKEFAELVEGSLVYVGDKTGMHVIAHGLDKSCIIEIEGNAQRRESTFCNPYNNDNVYRIESPNHFSIMDLLPNYAEAATKFLDGRDMHE